MRNRHRNRPEELSDTSVVRREDVIGVVKVDVVPNVTDTVVEAGRTDVEVSGEEVFDEACLFANSIKLEATSGSC